MTHAELKVELLAWTNQLELVAALGAKLCYSPVDIADLQERVSRQDQEKFIKSLVRMGHESPLEHVVFTFGIEGISRACSHQLVRHRLASYSQQSQRYVKADGFEVVIPPSIAGQGEKAVMMFSEQMQIIQGWYNGWLARGISPEDARFVLPNATATKIIVTMNARELLHFFKKRCCLRAQWEIRAMAEEMLRLVLEKAPIIFSYAGPPCLKAVCPEGKMTCGMIEIVREKFEKMKKVEE